MTDTPPCYYPGQYITDGKALFWVIERRTPTTLLVENALNEDRLEVEDSSLAMFREVKPDESGGPESGSRRSADSRGDGRERATTSGEDS